MLGIRRLVASATLRSKAGSQRLPAGARSFRTSSPMMDQMKVMVNGEEIEVENGVTVLQACEKAGIHVPRFCYHDRLSIAGNCRMCLVEVVKSPKPVASCAMPAMPNMQIYTDTPLVHKAREGVMEFLLANHPLDCPICDQGGECDLQEQSMEFGSDKSRFREFKRSVQDKNIGPLVKTVMTRCIHCTRCIRFTTEIAGVNDMGATGRGNAMEIGTYVDKILDTELSGNVVDLCPVGALTSKPYAMQARSWELQKTESVDVLDAVGANIRIDTRNTEVLRIIPRLNEDVNEEWLSDRSRHSIDGLQRQRLDTPMIKKDGEFVPVSWQDALLAAKEAINGVQGNEIMGVAGDLVDAEAMVTLKDFLNRLGCNNMKPSQSGDLNSDFRSQYLFNSTIVGVEDADAILLVGTNPRMEAPLLNARIRKAAVNYDTPVANIGPATNLTFDKEELGVSVDTLTNIEKTPFWSKLSAAERPMIVVGIGAIQQAGAKVTAALDALAAKLPNLRVADWDGVNFLHTNASRAAAHDIGFVPGVDTQASPKLVYLLGADEEVENIPADAFVIYQGSHGDKGANRANIILPGATYTEKSGTYVNMEGRAQRTQQATDLVGRAKQDWQIIRALSEVSGVSLPYNDLDGVRARMVNIAPHLGVLDEVEHPAVFNPSFATQQAGGSTTFTPLYDNHWMTNAISRSSRIMANCSASMPNATNSYIKQ